ncbi:glucose-6-phosphate isomerase [Agaricicola taiwanensis]|uniref:Glucose-6-phosphate isomerase n=1 Tax=Agaricicola taiwanensis TaxID=591372 RepID=A0A8J2YFS9_9RHOB|nr:glucose-6-phosphate isomerase [Agaricicola taiwanensis]GGE30280.1 glucose-6-phosphate isomerase [Agaricicola taiwanensis]
MPFKHNHQQVFTGPLTRDAYDATLRDAPRALDWLRQAYETGSLPLLRLPERKDDLDALKPVVERLRRDFDHVLVLGTGGSSLGGKTLVALADRGFGPKKGAPKLHFLDNIDPVTYADFFQATEGSRVGIVAISKSGSTAETLSQLLTVLPRLKGDAGRNLVIITEPTANPLRQLGERLGADILEHDPKVGGRYSVLSIVGLLPAMIAGLDAHAVRAGAWEVLKPALADREGTSDAIIGAALNVAAEKAGITTTVMMPYVDRLAEFGLWFRQLWAESLGKEGKGTTPVRAMGTVDQHSQVQLYLAGPADKFFTVITEPSRGVGDKLNLAAFGGDERLKYLDSRSMGDLLDAEARATYETLLANNRPSRLIAAETIDERVMGGLLMHFMLETMLAAQLMKIDAFDQPAVEEGKVLARKYLGEMA